MAIGARAYRRTIERRAAASLNAKIRKQNKRIARERHQGICKPEKRPKDTSSCHSRLINYGEQTNTSTLALCYPLLVFYPPHSGLFLLHAVVQPLRLHFAMKCSALYSAVLRHSPSSWAAVVHWLVLIPKVLGSSRKVHAHSYSCPRCL